MHNTATQVSASQAFRRTRTSMGLWRFIVGYKARVRHLRGKARNGRTYGVRGRADATLAMIPAGAKVALFLVMHHQLCNDAENPMKPNQAKTPGGDEPNDE